MMQPALVDLQAKIHKLCDERDWGQFPNPKDLAARWSLCLMQ
jgi:hypothetical protein